MDNDNKAFIRKVVDDLRKIQYVKPKDIPNIDLYMDQVTTFMDKHLETFKRYEEDKLLTKTMINNYTKNNLLPSPDKKKYSKDHMFFLIFIYYMKSIMSITDIQSLLKPLGELFFGKQGSIGLEEIYKEVFKMEEEQVDSVIKDVVAKYCKSLEAFPELEDDEDSELLQVFMFICLLCFDIYMKKQVIEEIIDEYFVSHENGDKSKGKEKSVDKGKDKGKDKVKK